MNFIINEFVDLLLDFIAAYLLVFEFLNPKVEKN
jgi:membrane-bound ClpP family serine protease